MDHSHTTERLVGLAAMLAGVWAVRHFGYVFWCFALVGLLWLPGLVVMLACEPISRVIDRIVAPLDAAGTVAGYVNALLNPIQNIADRIDGIHRKSAFKVFALWLAIGLSVLVLALLLLGLLLGLLVAAIATSQGRSRQPTGLARAMANQKEVVDIEVQYEKFYSWEPRGSCSSSDQEISRELERILERPGVQRARAIGRDSRRVYDTLQK